MLPGNRYGDTRSAIARIVLMNDWSSHRFGYDGLQSVKSEQPRAQPWAA